MRLATMTLVVADYDTAIDFYTDRLGFVLIADTALDKGKRWVVVGTDDGARLLLARAGSAEEASAIGNQTGGRVMGFIETDNFAAEHKRMIAQGVHFTEAPRHESYGIVAVFEDLYGNKWDLIEPQS